jgi:hypothetical protein
LLFSLFSPAMIPVLAEMIPARHRDDLVARRIADCEDRIAEAETSIKRLVRLAAKADDDETADAYDGEIKLIRADLNKVRLEHDRLRQQAAQRGENQEEQIAAVIAKLTDISDPQGHYDARSRLNGLLGSAIALTLHDDRTITVRINARGLNPVDARLTIDGVESLNVIDDDGSVLTQTSRAAFEVIYSAVPRVA